MDQSKLITIIIKAIYPTSNKLITIQKPKLNLPRVSWHTSRIILLKSLE